MAANAAGHLHGAVGSNHGVQVVKEDVADGSGSTHLANAVYGFVQNGGGRCYVVNVGEGKPISGGGKQRTGLDVLEQVDEVAIVAAPGFSDAASYDALLEHCERLEDRVAILDAPAQVTDIDSLTQVATSPAGGGARPPARRRARTSERGHAARFFPRR